MPYQTPDGNFERASSLGHVPTVGHPLVQEALGRYLMPATRAKDISAIEDSLVDPHSLEQTSEEVRWTIATDSSPFEHEVDPQFPSTRVLFMQMAAVIVDLEKMREREGPFADPVAIRDAQQSSIMAGGPAIVQSRSQRRNASTARVPRGDRRVVPVQQGRRSQFARRPVGGRS